MGKQLLNFQDSYYTVEFTFGTISFLLSCLSILLLYLTRRRSGFTYFNVLVLHQFVAQLTFDWCNVMTFFCFLKGFGNVDDDYYYDDQDDYLDEYRENWYLFICLFVYLFIHLLFHLLSGLLHLRFFINLGDFKQLSSRQ